ncbi:MAG: T9SS type A sorting domain-containing protein [Crocinitomicaceae bacterium]|nr:T9SS type A sorting domain-containing protein [Crocinitomicaceae bacterium]
MPYYSCVIERDNPNLIIVGGEFGVYYTENGGTSWSDGSESVGHVPVYDMGQNWRTFDEGCIKTGQIYVGTHGRGIWSTDAYLALPGVQDNLSPNKFVPDINVYPNPMNEVGNVQFDLSENSDVYIQIFSLNGQMVKEISQSNMTAGKNTITFETAELTKGTYVIRLTAGTMVETAKFIKH